MERMNLADVKGRIFDIQRYSIHDGYGIRTIVFLKGCRLRCKWCCNPESQNYDVEVMRTPNGEKTVGKDVTAGEVIDIVERDRGYYERSGGGLTLSGGECLCQPDFAYALLCLAKQKGISTAIESTAIADYSIIEKILPHLDCFLMDIKHVDVFKHKRFTTADNTIALENAKKIINSKTTELIARVPVIPKFNDTEHEIALIARFAVDTGIKKMHLLPYHRLGTDKYAYLGRDYELKDLIPPSEQLMQRLAEVAQKQGLIVKIGG